jgi:RNA polymerase sigma factor (sigma-70 family)
MSNRSMETSEDILLIEKTLKGDLLSFEKIVRKYNSIVYTLALRILKNHEEAEELSQDVFIKIYKSLNTFNHKSRFSTWIYRITYNNSINRLRSQKKYYETLEINDNIVSGFYDNFDRHEEEEEKKIILDCICSLPETERIIITLYYYDDMPVKEISEITGISPANVKVKLFRSRQKLYEELKGKLQYETTGEYEYKYK